RHTRSKRDWSSDVCSSDLLGQGKFGQRNTALGANALKWGGVTDAVKTLHDFWKDKGDKNFVNSYFLPRYPQVWSFLGNENTPNAIGRASCRERVEHSGERQ